MRKKRNYRKQNKTKVSRISICKSEKMKMQKPCKNDRGRKKIFEGGERFHGEESRKEKTEVKKKYKERNFVRRNFAWNIF